MVHQIGFVKEAFLFDRLSHVPIFLEAMWFS